MTLSATPGDAAQLQHYGRSNRVSGESLPLRLPPKKNCRSHCVSTGTKTLLVRFPGKKKEKNENVLKHMNTIFSLSRADIERHYSYR